MVQQLFRKVTEVEFFRVSSTECAQSLWPCTHEDTMEVALAMKAKMEARRKKKASKKGKGRCIHQSIHPILSSCSRLSYIFSTSPFLTHFVLHPAC